MKKKTILILLVSLIVVFYLIIRVDYEIMRNYSFNGKVERVAYNLKNIPTITIKGVNYELSYGGWDFVNNKIETGDGMIKIKGKMDLMLVKNNSRDTVNLLYKGKH